MVITSSIIAATSASPNVKPAVLKISVLFAGQDIN